MDRTVKNSPAFWTPSHLRLIRLSFSRVGRDRSLMACSPVAGWRTSGAADQPPKSSSSFRFHIAKLLPAFAYLGLDGLAAI